MKTKSGYETNGTYLKFKHYDGSWKVETETEIRSYKTEYEADMYIITKVLGCEKGYPICVHWNTQPEGCNKCKFGVNSNCSN